MKVLGIESSSLVASVALVTDDILTAEYTVNFKKTHSQTLLPMLDEIVKMLVLDLETIDAIATAGGPGSFTGLRIGAATAKGLGLALKKPLIHVPTVDAIAYNMWGASGLICPIMDAKRCQVYTGLYHMENGIQRSGRHSRFPRQLHPVSRLEGCESRSGAREGKRSGKSSRREDGESAFE